MKARQPSLTTPGTTAAAFVDADGNWALNSKANVEAVNYMKSLIDGGYCNASPYTDTRYPLQDAFNAGSQAFMIGACNMMKADSKVNYGVASIPTNNGTTPVALGVCDRLMVFKDKEAAKDQDARNAAISKFFDYFYNVDNYSKYMVYEGFLPCHHRRLHPAGLQGRPVHRGRHQRPGQQRVLLHLLRSAELLQVLSHRQDGVDRRQAGRYRRRAARLPGRERTDRSGCSPGKDREIISKP
jgi:hypothetical protein